MDPQEKARQVADYLRERAKAEAEAAARFQWPLPTDEEIQQANSRLAAGQSRQDVFGPHARFYLFEVKGARLIGRWNPHPYFTAEQVELSCRKDQWGHPLVLRPRYEARIPDIKCADDRALSILYGQMLRFASDALPPDWKRQLDSLHVRRA